MNFSPEFLPDTAYLLVIHGSRDPRPGQAAQVLADQVGQALGDKCLVESASLECASVPLHQQIVDFGDRIFRLGYRSLKIVPLFLSPGVHVREDIPEEVAFAQTQLGDRLSIDVLPFLGSYAGMVELLAQRIAQSPGAQVILMAHGSRRAGGNQPIEEMASQLGIATAYWSVAPKLMEQMQEGLNEGGKHIVIIPYFLFAGALTDAIAAMLEQVKLEHSDCAISLGEPLGETAEIIDLVVYNIRNIRQVQQNALTSCTLDY